MPNLKLLLLGCALGVLALPPAVRADRYVVEPGTAGVNPGAPYDSWTNAATNIQLAVDAAADGETIWVSNGTYKATGAGMNFVGTNMVYLVSNRKLRSVNGPEWTILDGGYPVITNRPVCLNSTGSVLSGFTVVNGCSGRGGGVLVGLYGGTVSNCLVFSNICDRALGSDGGGGMASYTTTGYTGYFYNCTVHDNNTISNHGAGGWLRGSVVMRDCEFYTNRCLIGSVSGGGCYINGNVKMNRCVFSNNYAAPSWNGGGVYLVSGALVAEDCMIVNNTAATGGGINVLNVTSDSIISNCVISGNTATSAGGGYYSAAKNGQCKVVNCVISSNQSGSFGGGAYINGAQEVFADCLIEGNYGYNGGGMHVASTNIACITNCIIRNNTAFHVSGGGGVALGGAGRLVGCLVVSNYVSQNNTASVGGGIKIFSTNAVCESCTVADNSVNGGSGGGIHMTAAGQVLNTIIYGNTAPTGPEWYPAGVGVFSNCCTADIAGMNGSGNIAADPAFVDTNAVNYRLAASSLCINAGLNQGWMSAGMDLDGRPRLDRFSGRVDMGCYEHLSHGTMFNVK